MLDIFFGFKNVLTWRKLNHCFTVRVGCTDVSLLLWKKGAQPTSPQQGQQATFQGLQGVTEETSVHATSATVKGHAADVAAPVQPNISCHTWTIYYSLPTGIPPCINSHVMNQPKPASLPSSACHLKPMVIYRSTPAWPWPSGETETTGPPTMRMGQQRRHWGRRCWSSCKKCRAPAACAHARASQTRWAAGR